VVGLVLLLAASSAVAGTGTRVSPETLAEIARAWVAERLPAAEQSSIVLVGTPRELVLPAGEVTTTVRLQAGTLAGGAVTVLIEALVTEVGGTRTARSTTVNLQVGGERDVIVAVRELPRRTIVARSDVHVERRPLGRIPPGALGALAEVVAKEVARPVAPGEIITTSAVTPAVAIRRGSAVTVRLDGPGFRIVTRGIASEDGAPGQTIRVVNQTSRREMLGTVEDARTVRIPF
jgi:flagella basal body P-ring formation protein FlgA